jgi:diketogulonate reductase-like aldo/keto reductase
MHQLQDLVLIHWPGAAHHALDSSAHAQLRLETWRVLEKFYTDGK